MDNDVRFDELNSTVERLTKLTIEQEEVIQDLKEKLGEKDDRISELTDALDRIRDLTRVLY